MNRKNGIFLFGAIFVASLVLYVFYDAYTPTPSISQPPPRPNKTLPDTANAPALHALKPFAKPSSADTDEVLRFAASIQADGWQIGCAQAEPKLMQFQANLLTQAQTVDAVWEEKVFVTAGCLSEIHLDEAAAIAILRKALALKPRDAQFINMLGTSYFRSGQDLEAEQAFASLLSDTELNQALWSSGWAGAVHEKLALVKLRIGTESSDSQRLNESKQLLQSADEFEGLTHVSPLHHGQMAAVDFSLGAYEQAISGYAKALSLLEGASISKIWSPAMISKMKAEYTMETGQIYFLQGKPEQAAQTMQTAIEYAQQSADHLLIQTMQALHDNTLHNTPVDLGKYSHIKRVPLE